MYNKSNLSESYNNMNKSEEETSMKTLSFVINIISVTAKIFR